MLEERRKNDRTELLCQNQVSEETFLSYHLEEVSGGIDSSFKATVCLQDFGPKVKPFELSSGF